MGDHFPRRAGRAGRGQPSTGTKTVISLFSIFVIQLFVFIYSSFFFISMNVVVVFFHLFIYKLGKKIGYLSRLVSFFLKIYKNIFLGTAMAHVIITGFQR